MTRRALQQWVPYARSIAMVIVAGCAALGAALLGWVVNRYLSRKGG